MANKQFNIGTSTSKIDVNVSGDLNINGANVLETIENKATAAATQVKNDLLNNAGAAYDTLKELGDLIDENTDAIDALEIIAANKSDKGHNHDEDYLPISTPYAAGESSGGNAIKASTLSVTRATSQITALAASLPVDTEKVYFGGSDGVGVGLPTTYCIATIKKGNNHRTLIDCYNLETGDHYINGCKDTRDTTANPWTGWKLQPNANTTYDDRYYTETEIDSKISTLNTLIATKANTTDVETSLSQKTQVQIITWEEDD